MPRKAFVRQTMHSMGAFGKQTNSAYQHVVEAPRVLQTSTALSHFGLIILVKTHKVKGINSIPCFCLYVSKNSRLEPFDYMIA